MPNTKKSSQSEAANNALVPANQSALAVTETEESAALALVGSEVWAELADAASELELGFSHEKPRDILARNEPFHIIDAVHTTIMADVTFADPHNPMQTVTRKVEKPVLVFKLHMTSGDVVTTMQGANKVREKWAMPCIKARAAGVRVMVGPVKFTTIPSKTNKDNDAIIFQPQDGFAVKDEHGRRLV